MYFISLPPVKLTNTKGVDFPTTKSIDALPQKYPLCHFESSYSWSIIFLYDWLMKVQKGVDKW